MSITAPARSDHDIQTAVQDELEWTPDVEAAGIGVAVDDGTVSLSGEVDSYAERVAAMHAALRVRGVRAVVDEMSVHPRNAWSVTETDIAKEVERALKWASDVPDTIKAEIDGRRVTLTGTARWNFQRHAAERAVRYLRGVYSVRDDVTMDARPSALETEDRWSFTGLTRKVQRALRREWMESRDAGEGDRAPLERVRDVAAALADQRRSAVAAVAAAVP